MPRVHRGQRPNWVALLRSHKGHSPTLGLPNSTCQGKSMHAGCWPCPGPQPGTAACLAGKGRAGSAKHVWCEHPCGGTAKAQGVASPSPFPPEQLLGGDSATLSTSCPPGPLPTPIRGVALGQADQVASGPGAGPAPAYVNEDQPGSANSSCKVGDPLEGPDHSKGRGPSSPLTCAGASRWLGPNCLAHGSTGVDIQPLPPPPATSPGS